ncbi:S8 family peptidase [Streptomyces sp. NPDC090499]|uniref:S8 family peptidase n=1 Tax=Streptomyces sp. NPDC090499 TaxID=3365965 RepID=UPI00381DE093
MSGPASAGAVNGPDTALKSSVALNDAAGRAASTRTVTLLTGDRVVVGAGGRVSGVEMAEGREKVPVRVLRLSGRTLVVPADAQPLISDGRLDERLFDVGALADAARLKGRANTLGVIIGYRGRASAMKAEVRSEGGAQEHRSLKVLNADAVTIPRQDATKLWNTLTDAGRVGIRTAGGISHVWLDGVREASLDKSVPQIGAPTAWAEGYDGKGVKVAVLDTGVDADHPDLRTQVVAQKDFSGSGSVKDRDGHGTHVASIVAGTGAKSHGRYKGVAPGAKILSGKVLGDDGSGSDSGIIAGMEWAAAQGADVVNLSLSGPDTPGIDPLEAAVDKLSAEKGILFAVGAGNSGPGAGTVGSPGSADAALTVGAVDDNDELADFSSTGPRDGDGAVKPDVTAPGVDITAAAAPGSVIAREVGQNPPGYMTISGTSMATPHVAGAAAILKQAHPDWKYAELKGALTGSAKDTGYSPFQQGTGRIQVDKAIEQSVIAEASVDFGLQAWPHGDDTPVTRQLTYRNLGKTDVTLKLAVKGLDPERRPAPAGFFGLAATTVTVPAGGRASVDVTVDTRLGGTEDGGYSAYVTATGGGQTVRAALGVDREVESYDVTLKYIGRDGRPATGTAVESSALGMRGLGAGSEGDAVPDASGTARLRLAKGTYLLDNRIYDDPQDLGKGGAWLVRPKLDITRDTTVTIDARTAKAADVTVPDAAAKPAGAASYFRLQNSGIEVWVGFLGQSFKGLRTAHMGERIPQGLWQQWNGSWEKGAATEYHTVSGGPVQKIATGYTKHFTARQFATVKVGIGAAAPGKTGMALASAVLPSVGVNFGAIWPKPYSLPARRTLHLSTLGDPGWYVDSRQYGGARGADEVVFLQDLPRTYRSGETRQETFGTGVMAPSLAIRDTGVLRNGNLMALYLPMYTDAGGHAGTSEYSSVRTTLDRDGTRIVDTDDPMEATRQYQLPAADARYRLTASFTRSTGISAVSTRIDASWTFRSKKIGEFAVMPLSSVRFQPALGLDSTAPAGRTQSVPVKVEGPAAGRNLRSLSVYASYDDGRTWRKLTVRGGKVSVKNPERGRGIALRAEITDRKGNKSTVSVHNAYRGR